MKVAFLIRDLDRGGAQTQLCNLAVGLRDRGHQVSVVCFYDGGDLEPTFRAANLQVLSLGKRGRWHGVGFLRRLVTTLRSVDADVLYAILSAANVGSILSRPFLPRVPTVWGFRSAYMDLDRYDWVHTVSYNLERYLARFTDRILINSEEGRRYAVTQGFPTEKLRLIRNGIDTERFRPNETARREVRREWSLEDTEPLIGLVGRIDPMKDHTTFLRAAAIAGAEHPSLRFVCVGGGSEENRAVLRSLARDLGLGARLIWAGARSDMPRVYPALDILCLSSIGEGFPNVLAEAMACGIGCAVTDVGDTATIVGDTGIVVPPSDPDHLARALLKLTYSTPDDAIRRRRRIIENFALKLMIERTETELLDLVRPAV